MKFPEATNRTAFITGIVFVAFATTLGELKARGVIPYDADSKELLPVVAIVFFGGILLFVVGVRNLAPEELKTRYPGIYFPTNREGLKLILTGWKRALVWFFGVACAGALVSFLQVCFG